MRRNLLLLLPVVLFIGSCSKSLEDRLVGNWRLDNSYKRVFLGRDYFQTGYENGIFTFYENGDAAYISATDTMNGTWRADNYSNNYYNYDSGNWENRGMRYLRIKLFNFTRNRFIDWEFDNFSFKSGWQKIKAEQYSLSNDRVYEFVRQ
jgi:hypothetical protein